MVPTSLQEIYDMPHATFVGGGTDLMPLLKQHVREDSELVFLHRIAELQEIALQNEWMYLGSGTMLWELAGHPQLKQHFPAVAQAAAATASPQIQNIATLGGNIMQDRRCIYFNQSRYWRSGLPLCFKTGGTVCHQIPNSPVCRAIYYSDMATALLLYDAQAECVEGGVRRWIPLAELIARHSLANGLSADERLRILIIRFRLPLPPAEEKSGFYKYAMRASIDFPLINFALRCRGARPAKLIAGAVAHEPVELEQTARLLDGQQVSDDEVIAMCQTELKQLAKSIKESNISPALKRGLYRQIATLLPLRRED